MPVLAIVDMCESAEEVARRARAVCEKRRLGIVAEKKFPKPLPVRPVTFDDLVAAAYPAIYPTSKDFRIKDIQWEVCRQGHLTMARMLSEERSMDVIGPRFVAVMLSRHLTQISLPIIGRLFKRDHTTILHTVRRMQPVMANIDQQLSTSDPIDKWVSAAFDAYRNTYLGKTHFKKKVAVA